MTRKPPAYRRASAAFSPAGTRNTSAPASRAPYVFCLTPPIGPTRAVQLDLARRDHLAAAVDVVSELLVELERERQACRRPPTWPRSMSTLTGSLMLAAWATRMPMIARFASSGAATVSTVRSTTLPSRRRRSRSFSPGRAACVAWSSCSTVRHLAAVDGDDHVAARERLRRGNVRRDGLDERALVASSRRRSLPASSATAAATCSDRCISATRLVAALGEGRARRHDRLRRHERRAVRPGERQSRSTHARRDRDVDVVDAARALPVHPLLAPRPSPRPACALFGTKR